MHESVSATKPRIILLVTDDEHRSFVPAPVSNLGVYPCVLLVDNLRAAARQSNRLDTDEGGNMPLPLLRIRASERPVLAGTVDAIPFSGVPRLLAGLIADAVRASVATGAVVSNVQEATGLQQLHDAISGYLNLAGFDVTSEVPGWIFTEANQSKIGDTSRTSAAMPKSDRRRQ